MGLLPAMIRRKIDNAGSAVRHELSQAAPWLKPLSKEAAARLAATLPGPPPPTRWNSSSAPLPNLPLVEDGMRTITGGRRRSF